MITEWLTLLILNMIGNHLLTCMAIIKCESIEEWKTYNPLNSYLV